MLNVKGSPSGARSRAPGAESGAAAREGCGTAYIRRSDRRCCWCLRVLVCRADSLHDSVCPTQSCAAVHCEPMRRRSTRPTRRGKRRETRGQRVAVVVVMPKSGVMGARERRVRSSTRPTQIGPRLRNRRTRCLTVRPQQHTFVCNCIRTGRAIAWRRRKAARWRPSPVAFPMNCTDGSHT